MTLVRALTAMLSTAYVFVMVSACADDRTLDWLDANFGIQQLTVLAFPLFATHIMAWREYWLKALD